MARKRVGPKAGTQYDSQVTTSNVSEESAEQKRRGDVRTFMSGAMERFKQAAEAEAEWRKDSLDDYEFSIGKQWPSDIQTNRSQDGRPCLVMDQLRQSIKQVTNEQRQQRPAVQINPVGDGADKDVAEIIQGVCRHIEVASDAEMAYDTAFEHMVRQGFGAWRLMTGYLPGLTFDQEIMVKPILNPYTVYWDPSGIELDYSDKRYCFIVEDMPASEYRRLFKNTELASLTEFTSTGDIQPIWANKETVRVAEYFYLEDVPSEILKLSDGRLMWADEVGAEGLGEGVTVLDHRSVPRQQCKWAKLNAIEVIDGSEDGTEGRDFPCSHIPVQMVLGDDLRINGKRYLAGMVRNAKDPQRMYNYWVSAATEAIALAPKSPFVGAVGQFKTKRAMWEQANVRNTPFLEYDVMSAGGQPVAAPQRNNAEPPILAMSHMIAQAGNDVKASVGIYDASLGQKGPDQSGRAILARQKQGDVATLDYSDNLSRSMRRTGRIMLDMIQRVYDTARLQRTVKPDGTVSHVGVYNSKHGTKADAELQLLNETIKKVHDIGIGQYDVSVTVGPSFQSKRQEAQASILELIKMAPNLMAIAGDLMLQSMDFPYAGEIAKRLKKMMPPQLQDDPGDMDPEQKITALEQQLNALGQQQQQLTMAMQEAQKIIDTKQIEAQTKIQIEKMHGEIQLAVAEIGAKSQEMSTRIKLEMDLMHKFGLAAHAAGEAAVDRQTATQMADQAHARALQLADQKHQQALEQGQQGHEQALEQGEQGHEQALEQGAEGHEQALEQQEAAAPPEGATE